MLTALGLCFALFCRTASAQNTSITDTIIIIPNENVKILLLGNSLVEIAEYTASDSVITLLINDIDAASSSPDFPKNSLVMHYFIHANGKRRLKAESEDFVEPEINISKEIESLDLNLPPYLYTIHDLSTGIEMKIYIKDPELLGTLKLVNMNEALAIVGNDKKLLRRHYRVDISKSNDVWSVVNRVRFNVDQLEIEPSIGLGLLGNKWSPAAAYSLYLMFTDKHGAPSVKVGFTGNSFSFIDKLDEKLSDYYIVSMYKIAFKFNYSDEREKPRWLGITGGIVDTDNNNPLNNKMVYSLTYDLVVPLSISLDFIPFSNKKSVAGVSLLFNL